MTEWDVEPKASTGVERLEMLRSPLAATFDDAPAAAETVERVAAAAGTLHDVDPSGFDAVSMRTWLEGVHPTMVSLTATGGQHPDRPRVLRGLPARRDA